MLHKGSKIVYMRDSINNLSFLSYHSLTYDSERKNVLLKKRVLLTVSLLQFKILKKSKHAFKEFT